MPVTVRPPFSEQEIQHFLCEGYVIPRYFFDSPGGGGWHVNGSNHRHRLQAKEQLIHVGLGLSE